VLDNVSAAFPDGCNVGILGANGAGKSTLIRLLAGSEMPDRGRIRREQPSFVSARLWRHVSWVAIWSRECRVHRSDLRR
jgi:ABC-type Mn2+/Zn2+ transport system ATPase subunit